MRKLSNFIKSILSGGENNYSFKRALVLFVVFLFAALLITGTTADPKLVDALTLLAGGAIAGNVAEKFS